MSKRDPNELLAIINEVHKLIDAVDRHQAAAHQRDSWEFVRDEDYGRISGSQRRVGEVLYAKKTAEVKAVREARDQIIGIAYTLRAMAKPPDDPKKG